MQGRAVTRRLVVATMLAAGGIGAAACGNSPLGTSENPATLVARQCAAWKGPVRTVFVPGPDECVEYRLVYQLPDGSYQTVHRP